MSLDAPVVNVSAAASATLNFGETKLDFGLTTINWGPTSGSIASLTLAVPGDVEICAPTHKVSTGKFMEMIGSKHDSYVSKTGTFALKADYSSVSIGLCGLKVEAKSFYKKKVGLVLKSTGPAIGMSAVKFLSAGLISFS